MYTEREIFRLGEIVPLLEKCGLKLNGETDYTLGLYDGEELVATGSIRDHIAQMIAVDPACQGEGLSARVVSGLISRAYHENWLPLRLFTKPSTVSTFEELGFRLVSAAEPYAALLELGSPNIRDFCRSLQDFRRPGAAAGLFAMGGGAFGVYAAGGGAIASEIAIGGSAHAPLAIGRIAEGTLTFGPGSDPAAIAAAIRQAAEGAPRWLQNLLIFLAQNW